MSENPRLQHDGHSTNKSEVTFMDVFSQDYSNITRNECLSGDSFLDIEHNSMVARDEGENFLFGVKMGFEGLLYTVERGRNAENTLVNYEEFRHGAEPDKGAQFKFTYADKFQILETKEFSAFESDFNVPDEVHEELENLEKRSSKELGLNEDSAHDPTLTLRQECTGSSDIDGITKKLEESFHMNTSFEAQVKGEIMPESGTNIGGSKSNSVKDIKDKASPLAKSVKYALSPIYFDENPHQKSNTIKLSDDIFKNYNIEFDKEMSSILPDMTQFSSNQISSNYSLIQTKVVKCKNDIREIVNVNILDKAFAEKLRNNFNSDPKTSSSMNSVYRVDQHAHLGHSSNRNPNSFKKDAHAVCQEAENRENPSAIFTPPRIGIRHYNVHCDNCRSVDFFGKRFKCLFCWKFDLCEVCEMTSTHPHPMIRIVSPDDQRTFHELTRFYNLKNSANSKSEDAIKERFIRSMTRNEYSESFYRHLLMTHRQLRPDEFLFEMTRIFG